MKITVTRGCVRKKISYTVWFAAVRLAEALLSTSPLVGTSSTVLQGTIPNVKPLPTLLLLAVLTV